MDRRSSLLRPAIAVSVVLLALVARAGEDDGSGEDAAAAATKRMKAAIGGMVSFVGTTRLTEIDAKLLLQHAASFSALNEASDDEESEDDDGFHAKIEETYEKTGTYDFGLILAHEPYRKWAASAGVDAKAWLQRYFRMQTLFMRKDMSRDLADMKASLPEQLAQIEAMREQLGEETYQEMKAALEQSRAMLAVYEKTLNQIPDADDAEKKVLEVYEKKLRQAFDEDDDDGDDEDDDGGGDDEDMAPEGEE